MQKAKRQRDFSARDLEQHTWLRAASVAGEEGRRWVEAFQATPFLPGLDSARRALVRMREGDLEGGREQLRKCEQILEQCGESADASHAKVYERFLCGIIAYERFVARDYDGAVAALERGERAALEALDQRRFLLTMANIFCEFCVQRARVAREQRDWPALESYLDTARQMVVSRRPLCELADGEEIYVVTIARHFAQFELEEEDREMIAEFHDVEFLTRRFDKFIYRLPMPRHLVIPYQ